MRILLLVILFGLGVILGQQTTAIKCVREHNQIIENLKQK